ncbi:MAG: glycosyltransferase family 39 protein [Phycisphaerales bacterium]|nr:MAG: glycosyltransferase family 39 protein [Phycisphaerales bacterium]
MKSAPPTRRLILLALAALAIRLGYCAASGELGQTPDKYGTEYVLVGERLLQHGTMVSPLILGDGTNEPSCLMPPVYAGIVAAVYRIFGNRSVTSAAVLQTLNAAATAVAALVVFFVAQRLGDRRAGWIAALVVAVNPLCIIYTGMFWDTGLFTLAVGVVVLLVLRLEDRTITWSRGIAFGAVLGVVALINPALTIAYPLLVLWMLTRKGPIRLTPLLRGIAAVIIGWLVVIAPWTIRNYIHFEELVYIRSGLGLELWLGACPEADEARGRVFHARFPTLNPAEQERLVEMGEAAYLEDCKEKALAAIDANPWTNLKLASLRLVDYWAGTVFTHRAPGVGGWPVTTSRSVLTVLLCGEVLMIALGVAILVATGRSQTDVWWLVAIVLVFSVTYGCTHVFIRFRAPLEPLFAVLLGLCVTRIWPSIRRANGHRISDAAS